MNDQRFPELALPLGRAARELRDAMPPDTLLPAIHRHLARRAAPRPRTALSWLGWTGLSTACVALAAALVVSSLPEEDAASTQAQGAGGFVTVASSEAWQSATQSDAGQAWLVSTEIPQARLAALGLPYDPSHAGERLPAQLLMQGTGDVLAVRVNP